MYYIGEEVAIKRLSIVDLLPATRYYMTYDGSTTFPACHETVTWIILNKPIYITKQQVNIFIFLFPLCHPRLIRPLLTRPGILMTFFFY